MTPKFLMREYCEIAYSWLTDGTKGTRLPGRHPLTRQRELTGLQIPDFAQSTVATLSFGYGAVISSKVRPLG